MHVLPCGQQENDRPSFKDVAAKYKGDKDAQAKLESKVRKALGSFGYLPMPQQARA